MISGYLPLEGGTPPLPAVKIRRPRKRKLFAPLPLSSQLELIQLPPVSKAAHAGNSQEALNIITKHVQLDLFDPTCQERELSDLARADAAVLIPRAVSANQLPEAQQFFDIATPAFNPDGTCASARLGYENGITHLLPALFHNGRLKQGVELVQHVGQRAQLFEEGATFQIEHTKGMSGFHQAMQKRALFGLKIRVSSARGALKALPGLVVKIHAAPSRAEAITCWSACAQIINLSRKPLFGTPAHEPLIRLAERLRATHINWEIGQGISEGTPQGQAITPDEIRSHLQEIDSTLPPELAPN